MEGIFVMLYIGVEWNYEIFAKGGRIERKVNEVNWLCDLFAVVINSLNVF